MKTQYDLPSETQFAFTRTFDAERQLVWALWTQSRHLIHWWGPEGWSLPVCQVDFRVGGEWFYCMQGPDMRSCGLATYQEIDAPKRFVYTDAFADADGNLLDQLPAAETTLTFKESGGTTTVRGVSRYEGKAMRDEVLKMGVEAGLDQTLNRLEAYLETLA